MTQSLSPAADLSVMILVGICLLIYGTYRAVKHRYDYKQLLLWGALTDVGFICMGMGTSAPNATLGILLFAGLQLLARGVAWTSLNILSEGTDGSARALQSAGVRNVCAGAMFALGMFAIFGGAPFWLPEGRTFLVQAMVTSGVLGGISAPILCGISDTIFLWLHVDAINNVCFKDCDILPHEKGHISRSCLIFVILLTLVGVARDPILVALLGIGQGPLALWEGVNAHHVGVHPTASLLYVGAILTVIAGLRGSKWRDYLPIVFTGVAFVMSLFQNNTHAAGHLFAVMISGVGFVVSIYSLSYMAHSHRVTQYQGFFLLTFASLLGLVTASDLSAFFGYWEMMTFASYFLVIHEATPTALRAGQKYYAMCAGGAFVMLPGLMMLGAGNTAFAAIPAATNAMAPALLKTAFFLTLVGLAVKAGLVPLHSWLPDAHPAAPSSISGPLSGVITKTGIFGIVVLILGHAGYAALSMEGQSGLSWVGYGITFMGGLTLVFGELMALKQDDIKRMLAYSTMGQLGEITLVLGLGFWLSTVGALAHVVNHAIMKDLLFLGAGALILRAGSRKLEDLRGLGQHMPWTVTCMAVGLISIMGLPPFAGFFSKYLMIQSTIAAGYPMLGVLILLGSFVGVVYYTRILKTIVFDPRPDHLPPVREAPLSMCVAMGILAGASLLLGLMPQISLSLVLPVATAFFVPSAPCMQVVQSLSVSWPVYVLVPMLGGLLPVLFRRDRVKAGKSAVGVLLFTFVLVVLFGRDMDTLSFAFACIVPLLGACNMAYAVGYMEHSHTQWRFYAVFCCMCGGLIGVAAAKYLYSFFLFWEIMSSWTLYLAIAHEGTRESLREAFKYFLFNVIGAGFIFIGVTLIGPTVPLQAFVLWSANPNLPAWGGTVGVTLLAIGFIMKAAQLPFRIDWQMHPAVAPTPVSGYISSVLLKSAILGLIKLFVLLGGGLLALGSLDINYQHLLQLLTMWIGAVTIVMAALKALTASNLKLVFIYSTVSQIGYMVLAVGAGTALGYAGGMLHLVNHVFFKDLLFLICGAVMFQCHKDSLDDLGGIGRKMPFTLTMFAIAGLSAVGVPPTSGFSSKWIIYHALMNIDQPLLALLSLVGSVLTLAYIAKFLHAAFMGQPGSHLDNVTDPPATMRTPMLILGVGCIVTGVFPGLALMPINGVLTDYGMRGLDVGMSGVLSGPGAWNATGMAVMMGLALWGGWKFVTHFVTANSREIDIHSCGNDPGEAVSRMQPASIYASLMGVLLHRDTPKEN